MIDDDVDVRGLVGVDKEEFMLQDTELKRKIIQEFDYDQVRFPMPSILLISTKYFNQFIRTCCLKCQQSKICSHAQYFVNFVNKWCMVYGVFLFIHVAVEN